jgi:hypothetical protein
LGAVAENAMLFGAYNQCKTFLVASSSSSSINSSSSSSSSAPGRNDDLSLFQLSLAGAGAGMAVSFILTPVELVKCRLQVQNSSSSSSFVAAGTAFQTFSGPMDVIRQTIQKEGVVRGLYRGHLSTMYREIPGNFCYFGVYECVVQQALHYYNYERRSELSTLVHMGGGVLAGMAYWTAFYPADTIKSLQQTHPSYANKTFSDCFVTLYRQGGGGGMVNNNGGGGSGSGLRRLYRGWGLTVTKAAPTNALIFAGYEYTMAVLSKD